MNMIPRVFAFLSLGILTILLAQTKPAPSGHWEGSIALPDMQLNVIVDLDRDVRGAWTGDIDIPAQGAQDLPLKGIVVSDSSVSFEITIGPGNPRFEGRVSEDGASINGEFIQGGNKFPFSLKRTGEATIRAAIRNPPLSEEYLGKWEGILETPGGKLRLAFHLANTGGSGVGTIDSYDQGAMGIPMSEISASGGLLTLSVRVVGGSYEGKLSEDAKVLTGTWSQGGVSLPLALKRTGP